MCLLGHIEDKKSELFKIYKILNKMCEFYYGHKTTFISEDAIEENENEKKKKTALFSFITEI